MKTISDIAHDYALIIAKNELDNGNKIDTDFAIDLIADKSIKIAKRLRDRFCNQDITREDLDRAEEYLSFLKTSVNDINLNELDIKPRYKK